MLSQRTTHNTSQSGKTGQEWSDALTTPLPTSTGQAQWGASQILWLSTPTEGYWQQTQKAQIFPAISAPVMWAMHNLLVKNVQLTVSLEAKAIDLTLSLGRGRRCILTLKMKQRWVTLQDLVCHMVWVLRIEMWTGLYFASNPSSIHLIKGESVIRCHCGPRGWSWLQVTGQIHAAFMMMELKTERCFQLKLVWILFPTLHESQGFWWQQRMLASSHGELYLHSTTYWREGLGFAGFPTALTFGQSLAGLQNCVLVWQDILKSQICLDFSACMNISLASERLSTCYKKGLIPWSLLGSVGKRQPMFWSTAGYKLHLRVKQTAVKQIYKTTFRKGVRSCCFAT